MTMAPLKLAIIALLCVVVFATDEPISSPSFAGHSPSSTPAFSPSPSSAPTPTVHHDLSYDLPEEVDAPFPSAGSEAAAPTIDAFVDYESADVF